MKVNRALTLFFFLMASGQLLAQSELPSNGLIKYDPLFWKNELHLNPSQSSKIREINFEFYEELEATLQEESDDRSVLRNKVSQSLINRSEKIWQTLEPRQRRKLEKIMKEDFGSARS